MPYPKKLLNADETVALDLHPHWWFFSEAAGALILSIIAGIAVLVLVDSDSSARKPLLIVVLIAVVLSAIWLFRRYSKWVTTNFVITNDRIIFRQGVIAKSGIEIPLDRVNNVNFHQSIFERMLGAGDLLIESGGEDGQQRFTDVRKPQNVQNLIHSQVEAKNRQRGAYAAPVVTAAPLDVAGQLEKLEGLLQRGSLSQEEFDAQKARLLGA
ncbi:MAG: hypothetical protein JWN62_4592 [Acidimicrobiales bacterium]|nr:hypothetical protein [Acidimicrobiales bacterium]